MVSLYVRFCYSNSVKYDAVFIILSLVFIRNDFLHKPVEVSPTTSSLCCNFTLLSYNLVTSDSASWVVIPCIRDC